MKKNVGIFVIIIGFIAGCLCFSAASNFEKSGNSLLDLRSVGGTSIAEAYYQEIGSYGLSYSKLSYALGLGIIAITIGIGSYFIFSNFDKEESKPKLKMEPKANDKDKEVDPNLENIKNATIN